MRSPPSLSRGPLMILVTVSCITGLGLWKGWRPGGPAASASGRLAEAAPTGRSAGTLPTGRPQIILDPAGPAIFPKSWLSREIDAKAKPLEARETARSRRIIGRSLAKYPDAFMPPNLRRIYVLGDLEFCQVSASGTNSREDIYIVNQGAARNFPDP